RMALDLLIERMADPQAMPRHALLEPRIVLRSSTGARQPRGVVHTGPAEPNPATMRKTSGYA
ncbi:hypothetical protein ACFQ1S_15245, partial [Kibdelosporangium lantanae]